MDSALKMERLEARVPGNLKELLQQAAALTGQTLTDFVISASAAQARQIIAEHQRVALGQEDQETLARALLHPPKPNARLRRAAAQFLRDSGK